MNRSDAFFRRNVLLRQFLERFRLVDRVKDRVREWIEPLVASRLSRGRALGAEREIGVVDAARRTRAANRFLELRREFALRVERLEERVFPVGELALLMIDGRDLRDVLFV